MILREENLDVKVSGNISNQEFKIKASSKAFQILSSNLYSNPLGAVIRELSTNAYDAHVMAGKKDEPFVIKLPTTLAPQIVFRDRGTGLSDEEITNIYTTIFESTKTSSNDVVGCLGLGSKSPLGITDAFTVTSYYYGTKSIYSIYMNERKIPSCALFMREFFTDEAKEYDIQYKKLEKDLIKPQEYLTVNDEIIRVPNYEILKDNYDKALAKLEPYRIAAEKSYYKNNIDKDLDKTNGLEISIGIKETDFSIVKKEIKKQLFHFDVKPTIIGEEEFDWFEDERVLIAGNKWKITEGASTFNRGPKVIQGQIAYPIDITAMGSEYDNAPSYIRELLNKNIFIEVDIGKVQIAPSREALTYDELTVKNILDTFEDVVEDLIPNIKEQIAKEKTHYDAILLWNSICSGLGIYKNDKKHNNTLSWKLHSAGIKWKNKDIDVELFKFPKKHVEDVYSFRKYSWSKRWEKDTSYRNIERIGDKREFVGWACLIAVKNQKFFIATADDKSVDQRVKQYVTDNEYHQSNTESVIIRLRESGSLLSIKRCFLGKKDITLVKDLPKIRRKKPTSTGNKNLTVFEYRHSRWSSNKTDLWASTTVENENDLSGSFYIDLERFDPMYKSTLVNLQQLINASVELGIIDIRNIKLFGLRARNRTYKSVKGFECFMSYLEEKCLASTLLNKKHYTHCQITNILGGMKLEDMKKNNMPEDIIDIKKKLLQASSTSTIHVIARTFKSVNDKVKWLTSDINQISDKYSLIRHLPSYLSIHNFSVVFRSIDQEEREQKNKRFKKSPKPISRSKYKKVSKG